MVKLIVGIVLGIILCTDAGMIIFCLWFERQHPNWSITCRDTVCDDKIAETRALRYTQAVRHGATEET